MKESADPTYTIYFAKKATSLGIIVVLAAKDKLTGLHFLQSKHAPTRFENCERREAPPIVIDLFQQMEKYSQGQRRVFDIKYQLFGTELQTSVWHRIKEIPYGETISYKQLATDIGKPNSIRAVANAVGKNPISILIPCHRVIGTNRSLTGYAGGLPLKKKLLNIETTRQIQHIHNKEVIFIDSF